MDSNYHRSQGSSNGPDAADSLAVVDVGSTPVTSSSRPFSGSHSLPREQENISGLSSNVTPGTHHTTGSSSFAHSSFLFSSSEVIVTAVKATSTGDNLQSSSFKTPLSLAATSCSSSFSHCPGLKSMKGTASGTNFSRRSTAADDNASSPGLDPILSFLFPVVNDSDELESKTASASRPICKKRAHGSVSPPDDDSTFPPAKRKKSSAKCDSEHDHRDNEFEDHKREHSVSELVEETELSSSSCTVADEDGSIIQHRNNAKRNGTSDIILSALPREVLEHCLSFLDCLRDRSNTARTCKAFNSIMLAPQMLRGTVLFDTSSKYDDSEQDEEGTDQEATTTNDHNDRKMISFVNEDEDIKVLLRRLQPFLEAGNIHAMYIAGMVRIYCHDDVVSGISWLETAAEHDFDEALYSLGIITRDAQRERSMELMDRAHKMGFFPATMEVMNARELREVHGEPSADALRAFLGPTPLHRLIRRYFCDISKFRSHSSSHCWNPLCGRWAYKYPREHVVAMQHHLSLYESSSSATSGTGTGESALSQHNRGSSSAHSPPKCARMKMCSSCRRAKYCSKICQVYDWRSGRHKLECQFIG